MTDPVTTTCPHCGSVLSIVTWECVRGDACPGAETPDDFDRCPTCEGSGSVNPLTAPKGHFVAGAADCPHCDGTGRI